MAQPTPGPTQSPSPGDEANLLNTQLGELFDAGRYAEAEPLARRALELREGALGPDHPLTLVSVNNLATLHHARGHYAAAEPLLRRVFETAERLFGGEHPATMGYISNLATLLSHLGRYAEAERLSLRVLEARERVLGRDDIDTLASTSSLAGLYRQQRRYAAAEIFYRRALDGQERALGPSHPSTLSTVHSLGALYQTEGRNAEAEPLLRRAFEQSDAVLGREHPVRLDFANSLASLYVAQGRHAEAELLFVAILDASERPLGQLHPRVLGTASNLALLYGDLGRYAEARSLIGRTLTNVEQAFGPTHPATLTIAVNAIIVQLAEAASAPEALASARLLLRGLRQRRDASAIDHASPAQREREAQTSAARFALFADGAWGATTAIPQQRAVVLPEAFGALQDSLAGSADRSIAEQAARRYVARGNAALADAMRERQQLESEWSRLDAALAAAFSAGPGGTGEQPAAVRAQLDQVQGRIQAIDARLRAEAPDYFALIAPSSLDVPAAQQLLAPDEAILLAVPSRFGTHVMAITPDRITWHVSDWNAERVRAAVQTLRRDIDRRPRFGPNGARAFDRTTAHQLYQELIAPVASLLAGRRQVYVAAGGSLAALPFSMLVSAPPSGADDDPAALRSTRWFGDEAALVHIPSIQSLALLRQAPRSGGERSSFFGIGNPVLRGETAGAAAIDLSPPRGTDIFFEPGRTRDGGIMANIATLHRLSPLPGTARELEAVRATLGAPASSLLMAERATEPNVRAADLSRTSILLFSTHGLTVAEGAYVGAGESGLVLTPPAEPRDGDDGFLAASEVTTLRLDADWVILSACNTATGDGVNGAGLGGLARAFFYAGARNLLASHWLVSDEVAPDLITRTLALERSGTPRAEAFRQAMRATRTDASRDTATRSLAHPYYWAPFVLVGNGGR